MEQVRRSSDGELCGLVAPRHGRWAALTVFGAVLGVHDDRDGAVAEVLSDGLASLAARWTLRDPSGGEEVVCILEVDAARVTVARGYYSMPGVPTLAIATEQLAAGEWELRRDP